MRGGVTVAALGAWRDRAQRYVDRELWLRQEQEAPLPRLGRRALQLLVIVAQGVTRDQILLRASALTYFSMLSLLPLLALAFSLVGGFGVSDDLMRVAVEQLAAGVPEAQELILERMPKVNFAGLGTVGAAALFLTTVLALGTVERAFNRIWGVERERALVRRLPDYLAVLIVAPLLLGVALSLATTLQSQTVVQRILEHPELRALYKVGLRQAPTVMIWAAFTFLYWFLPNTSVRAGPALLGGGIAAVLFTLAQQLYVGFNIGATRADAVFGGFALLPLLLVWLYISWAIVLLGAEFAFAAQNLATFRRARQGEEPGPAAREAVGLAVAARVARAFAAGQGATAEQLADQLDVPVRSVRAILHDLDRAGLVARRGADDPETYQLGRAADAIRPADVMAALRGPQDFRWPEDAGRERALFERAGADARQVLESRTLEDLAGAAPPKPAAEPGDERPG